MDNTNKFTLIGWVCLVYSFVTNFQLTLAIILAIAIMLVTLTNVTDKYDTNDIEEVTRIMNTSLDELKEFGSMLFMGVSSFIMWVVVFYRFLSII